jgi:hypothetical protein
MSITTDREPPTGFLSDPAPSPSKTVIDFSKTKLSAYEGFYAVILEGVFSAEECQYLIAAAEETNNGIWDRAMINAGGDKQLMAEEARKCGRIIWDNQEVVDKVWKRCEPLVPEIQEIENWPKVAGYRGRNTVWSMKRLNKRMRFLKYSGGEYFTGMGLPRVYPYEV